MFLFTSRGKNILIGLVKLELSSINDSFHQNGTKPETVHVYFCSRFSKQLEIPVSGQEGPLEKKDHWKLLHVFVKICLSPQVFLS